MWVSWPRANCTRGVGSPGQGTSRADLPHCSQAQGSALPHPDSSPMAEEPRVGLGHCSASPCPQGGSGSSGQLRVRRWDTVSMTISLADEILIPFSLIYI